MPLPFIKGSNSDRHFYWSHVDVLEGLLLGSSLYLNEIIKKLRLHFLLHWDFFFEIIKWHPEWHTRSDLYPAIFHFIFAIFLTKMTEFREENIFTIFFGDFEIRSEMTGHQVMILGWHDAKFGGIRWKTPKYFYFWWGLKVISGND